MSLGGQKANGKPMVGARGQYLYIGTNIKTTFENILPEG